MSAALPSISVVVPTRDRPLALGRCLAALRRQSAPVEIVVVADGGDANPAAAAASRVGATLLVGDGGGPASARNLGAAAGHGEILCFTDDDCEPTAEWAALLVTAAREGGGAAAGRTLAPERAGPAVRASQAVIDHLQLGSDPSAGEKLAFAPSCNLACSREVFAVTGFDESFALAAGEDRAFSDRLAAAGHSPVYCPGALVVHHQQEGGLALLRRQYRYGRGAVQYRRRGGRLEVAGARRRQLQALAAQGRAVIAFGLAGQAATAAGALRESLVRG